MLEATLRCESCGTEFNWPLAGVLSERPDRQVVIHREAFDKAREPYAFLRFETVGGQDICRGCMERAFESLLKQMGESHNVPGSRIVTKIPSDERRNR